MSPAKDKHSLLGKVYKTTFDSLNAQPSLLAPFFIFAIFELVVLFLLFLSPRMPLKLLFGPPIRTFWGEMFLHYPANFLLLPKLESLSRMVLSVFLGGLTTGAGVLFFSARIHKKRLSLVQSFGGALKKYLTLFIIVFLITVIFYAAMKLTTIGLGRYFLAGHQKLLFIGPALWMGPILICITFIEAVLIQGLFAFAIPALVIGQEKLISTIVTSYKLFAKYFLLTVILVSLPMLAYVPFIVLNYNGAFLIETFFPELILLVLIGGVLISSLVVDALVTISTAALYLIDKEK